MAGIEASQASSAKNLLGGGPSSSSVSASTSSNAIPSSSSISTTAPVDPSPSSSQPESVDDRKRKAEALFSKRRLGEGEVQIDENRLAEAIKEERARKRKGRGRDDDSDGEEEWEKDRAKGREGKRKKGDKYEVTEEELEAYRMNRRMTEDPMANYVDEEDL